MDPDRTEDVAVVFDSISPLSQQLSEIVAYMRTIAERATPTCPEQCDAWL